MSFFNTKTLQTEIEGTIRQLTDLSLLLRRQGSPQHWSRATNFTPKNEEGKSLLPEFANHINSQCRRMLEQENDFQQKDFLAKRVSQTIIRRWRLMCYQIHHADRISTTQNLDSQMPVSAPKGPDVDKAETIINAPQAVAGTTTNTMAVAAVARTEHSFATMEQNAATTLPADHRPSIPKPEISPSMASSRTQFNHGTLAFPRPPKAPTNGWEFVCPYCCLSQPAKNLARPKWE